MGSIPPCQTHPNRQSKIIQIFYDQFDHEIFYDQFDHEHQHRPGGFFEHLQLLTQTWLKYGASGPLLGMSPTTHHLSSAVFRRGVIKFIQMVVGKLEYLKAD